MIKFIKQGLKNRMYRWILKKHYEPRKDFLKKSKILFLQKLREEAVVTEKEFIRIPVYRAVLKYSLALIFAILILSTGSIIFAEKQNVDPNHPLYEFKKLGETIQIKFAAEEKKPILHQEFAERRLEEIKQLKIEILETKNEDIQNNEKSESSVKRQETINNLEEDFHGEVNAILEKVEAPKEPAKEPEIKIEETNGNKQSLMRSLLGEEYNKNLCQSVSEIMEKHEEITPDDKEEWHEFDEKCHRFFEEKIEQQKENTQNNSKDNSWRQNNEK